jgi:hypothetical protein
MQARELGYVQTERWRFYLLIGLLKVQIEKKIVLWIGS